MDGETTSQEDVSIVKKYVMLNRLNKITLLDNFLFPSSNQLPGTVLKLLHCHGPLKSVLQDELVSLIKLLVLILLVSKNSPTLVLSMMLLFVPKVVQEKILL